MKELTDIMTKHEFFFFGGGGGGGGEGWHSGWRPPPLYETLRDTFALCSTRRLLVVFHYIKEL